MNKEMQKLLRAINDKKNEVKSLVAEGKLDKAKAAKEELKTLQEKFDLLFDLDEEEHEEIEDKVAAGKAKTISGGKADKKNLVKSFVNIIKAGFFHREPDEDDVKVYKDALTSDATPDEDGESGIGVTIPDDIRTDIIELRRSDDNLEQYVNVEGVTTKTGTRNIEVDAESVPFDVQACQIRNQEKGWHLKDDRRTARRYRTECHGIHQQMDCQKDKGDPKHDDSESDERNDRRERGGRFQYRQPQGYFQRDTRPCNRSDINGHHESERVQLR